MNPCWGTAAGEVLSLAIGALGEVLDYRLCMTICGLDHYARVLANGVPASA
ncbi:MAG: hypothetical protein V8T01_06260 [Oscillospiraceae bacterium]